MMVTLVARKKGQGVLDAKHRLIEYLKTAQIDFQVDDHPNTLAGLDELSSIQRVDLSQVHAGLLVSLGGDGSLLRLVDHASHHQLPLVGINLGRVGFLTDLCMDDLSDLRAILTGTFQEDHRSLLEVIHPKAPDTPMGVALNDIMISAKTPGKNLDFTVTIDNTHTFTHHADGFLVSTPTGSTAYALSAGGPIIHPSLDVHLLTPICSHRLSTRPLVIAPSSEITIKLGSLVNRQAVLCADGQPLQDLAPESSIVIRRAKQRLRLLHPKSYQFFSNTQRKLHWES